MKILIVCASNICRSPYVEYLLRREIYNNTELADKILWVKSSAVLNQMRKIHPKAKIALLNEGFTEEEIDSHIPSYIWFDYRKFKEADLIIGMSKSMKYLLPPWLYRKYKTLSELAGEDYKGIPDPYLEKTQEGYNEVMTEIKGYVMKYVKLLENDIVMC